MLIGLIGNKRVGKSTFADYIVDNKGFKTIAFADPIKEGVKIMFDLTEEQVNGDLKEVVDKRWGLTPRQFLQTVGTDLCRNTFGQDVWIKRMKMEIEKKMSEKSDIIVSDIRFPNEAEAVKEMGGILIKIENPRIQKPNDSGHISEKLIDQIKYDKLIINDKNTVEQYHKDIDNLLLHIIV